MVSEAIDWLGLCRRATAAHKEIFAVHRGGAERNRYDGVGEGGDRALVIDRLCEDAVFAELDALASSGHALTAISEERGQVTVGSGEPEAIVVIDPIDGSLNARRALPSHSFSFAAATGDSMAEVEFGYVFDFGAGEEFAAARGKGATLNGSAIESPEEGDLEIVGLESAKPEWILPIVESLRGSTYRLRAVGSIAISLSYVAAGRFDGLITARGCRSVDAAAAQLIAAESGAVVEFEDHPLDRTPLDLDSRYRLIAARDQEGLAALREAQNAAPRVGR